MNYLDRRLEIIQAAEAYAQEAKEKVPDLPEVYRSLGRIKQTTGQVKEAAANYLKAVTYREDYYEAYRSLAWLAKDCFRYDEAQQWIRKALSINASDLETIFLSGVVHFEKKESKLAVNDFTRGIELRPDYGRAHFFRGMTYWQFGRIDSAITDMIRAVELGGDINAPYILGYYYLVQKDFKAAERALNLASKRSEIAFIAQFYLGLTCLLCGRAEAKDCFAESLRLCRETLKREPDLTLAKAILAENLAFLESDEDECHRLLTEVSNYIVNDGAMAQELARAYAILGDIKKSEKYVTHAIETYQGPTEIEISLDPILRHYRPS
jgi:tetratricopeptide (TPR) repeat protein